jgi:hypothetical protein
MKRPYDEDDPALRPRNPRTGDAMPEMQQPGYYRGFSTMSQSAFWDAATRALVTRRLEPPFPFKFFNPEQAKFWTAVFNHVIPQTDRTPDYRIPVLVPLDQRLHENRTAGYRFENMPHDRDVYGFLGIEAIDGEAQVRYRGSFLNLPHFQQELVLKAIHDGEPEGGVDIWKRMSVHRFWQLIMTDAVDGYYSHPWAWDEIGFGGPAYPRAYMRLERGEPEPWEVEESRYEWDAPHAAISDDVDDASHHHTEALQHQHKPGADRV